MELLENKNTPSVFVDMNTKNRNGTKRTRIQARKRNPT